MIRKKGGRREQPIGLLSILLRAFVSEEVLLSEPGEGAEVLATEVRDLGGFPSGEIVASGHGLEDPGIDGEGFEFSGTEEEHAIGDFLADAGEFHESGFRVGVGKTFGFGEPPGMLGEESRGAGDVAGSESE